MKRRLWLVATVLVAAVAVLSAFALSAQRAANRRENDELGALAAHERALRDTLSRMLERDPILTYARSDTSGIVVALSESLLVDILHGVARVYLDRIEVNLSDLQGHGEGGVERPTPIGHRTLGRWSVKVSVNRMSGLLTALDPTVDVTRTNRVHLVLPIVIVRGRGDLTLHFAWNSQGIFNLVCRDFETTLPLSAEVLRQQHDVRGDLVLSAQGDGIVIDPEFPPDHYPISMTLNDESWKRIRAALEEEDRPGRCGLIMNADSVVVGLQRLGISGLKFRLPRAIFRTLRLPASLTPSVQILDSPVDLAVRPHALRLSPGLVWYSAEVDARRSMSPARGPRTPAAGDSARADSASAGSPTLSARR